jgi:hypothetical protein
MVYATEVNFAEDLWQSTKCLSTGQEHAWYLQTRTLINDSRANTSIECH